SCPAPTSARGSGTVPHPHPACQVGPTLPDAPPPVPPSRPPRLRSSTPDSTPAGTPRPCRTQPARPATTDRTAGEHPVSDAAYFVPVPRPDQPDHHPDLQVETFRPTDHTVSTWGPHLQHGAPPSALLARAVERHRPRPDTRLTRLTVELLGPVPLTDIEVRTRIERPGRRIELVVAELWAGTDDGPARAVARGTGWRLET